MSDLDASVTRDMADPRDLALELDMGPADAGIADAGLADAGADGGAETDAGTASSDPESTIDSPTGDVVIDVGASITFEGSCSDADGDTPFTHAWSFDGVVADSDVEDPGSITFDTAGAFDIFFVCTDAGGASDPTPATRHIEVVAPALLPLMGDIVQDGRYEVFFVDPEAVSATAIDPIPGGWPAHASVDVTLSFRVRRSPNGRYVSFIADIETDGEPALYVVDAGTPAGAAVKISDIGSGGRVVEYEWSPDSTAIAFSSFDGTGEASMWIVELSGGLGSATPIMVGSGLASIASHFGDWPRWSRDSSKHLFIARVGSQPPEAFLYDRNNPGMGQQRIHPPLATGAFKGVEDALVVADTAVIIGDLDDDLGVDIYAVDLGGTFPGTAHRLTAENANFMNGVSSQRLFYALSSSGDELIFPWLGATTINPARPYQVDLSGGAAAAAGSATALTVASDPSRRVVDYWWSPDDRRLAVLSELSDGNEMVQVFERSGAGATFGSYLWRTAVRMPTVVVDDVGWSPDGRWLLALGDIETPGVIELRGVDFSAATLGGGNTLNGPLVAGGAVDGLGRFASPEELVYVADADVDGVKQIFSVDPSAPGAATEISPAVTASPPNVGFDDSRWQMRALPNGKVVAIGDWRTAGVLEPVLLDPAGGAPTPLLPPLAAGLGVRFVPD